MHRPDPGQQALRFVAWPWRHMVVLGDHPLVILERGLPWDDHGYKTLFQVYYYEPGMDGEPRRLGAVKILERGAKVTRLPHEEVDGLDERFCSLGQDLDYYENMMELGEEERPSIAARALDEDAIAHHTTELETNLDIVADLLTSLVEPGADEALSLGEILARHVREGVVSQKSVETADKLLEYLGSTGSDPGDQGILIGHTIRYDSLEELIEDLRALAQHLNPE